MSNFIEDESSSDIVKILQYMLVPFACIHQMIICTSQPHYECENKKLLIR